MDCRAKFVALRARTLVVVIRFRLIATERNKDMTYYRVEFLLAQPTLRPAKRFLTEEKAKKHARRILGVADDSTLITRVSIVAIGRDGTPVLANAASPD